MTTGSRAPTSKERENNKRRERKRRAIAARIFSGLRQFGNYKLPKHCDNNEVLKALCREAGWIAEEDGTTFKLGCKPLQDRGDCCISSTRSPESSPCPPKVGAGDGLSLIPWLKGLSSSCVTVASTAGAVGNFSAVAAATSRTSGLPPLQVMRGGTCSAPVSPPLSSPRMASNVQLDGREFSIKAGEALSSDCGATAFSNAYNGQTPFIASTAASGTSTPTYPPVFVMSGSSTPSHFIASGSATPFLPSGASTPTYASSMRGMPPFNFAVVAAMAGVQRQQAQGKDWISPTLTSLESDRVREIFQPSTNIGTEMEWRQENSRQPEGVNSVYSRREIRRDTFAGRHERTDLVGKSDVYVAMDMKVDVFATRFSGTTDDMLAMDRDINALDQIRLSSWLQSQDGGALAAAPAPDSRGIVPKGFRTVTNVEQGPFNLQYRKNRSSLGMVKPWEGETIHEVSLEEEGLELTLGNASMKAAAASAANILTADISNGSSAATMSLD